MKNKALNAFYRNLLEDVGVKDVNGDGLLSYAREEANDFLNISLDGKRLALPTRDNLKHGNDKLIIFHPASEQLMSGPSPVLDALREYMMIRLSTTAQAIAGAAMTIASDVKLQKKVKGSGNELLKPLSAADEKMEDTLDKVFEKVGLTPDNRIYNLFLVATGSKSNPRGIRTTKVSYPIMDDAYSDDPTEFFGVKMPRKTRDKPGIVGLLATILGVEENNSNQIDEYTSDLRQAPYFHSLLTAFLDITNTQNRYLNALKNAIPSLEELVYKQQWIEEYEDFENFIKLVGHAAPLLPGNAGKPTTDADEEVEEKEVKKSSWKDLRDSIDEEPEYEERPQRERPQKQSGWRSLLKTSKEESRNEGISFGRGRSKDRRGGFSGLGERDDDRYDRNSRYGRGRDRDYNRRAPYSNISWKDSLL